MCFLPFIHTTSYLLFFRLFSPKKAQTHSTHSTAKFTLTLDTAAVVVSTAVLMVGYLLLHIILLSKYLHIVKSKYSVLSCLRPFNPHLDST